MIAALTAASLAGCGSTNLLGPSDTSAEVAGPAVLPVQQAQPQSRGRVGIAPIMGAPDTLGKQMAAQLGSALEKQRVSIVQTSDKPDYTLRGYMSTAPERGGTKVSYLFDLTDATGKRVNRIQGEEIAKGGTGADRWAAVTPELSQQITDKAAGSLAQALSSLGTPSPGGGPSAAIPSSSGASTTPAAVGASPISTAPGQPVPGGASAVSGPTTGSIDRTAAAGAAAPTTALAAIVPAVTGAPGDGNTALSGAMRQELLQSGIGSATAGQRAYSVIGKVTMSEVKEGKQSIKIDWRVTDPAGGLLATVSQNNEIEAGSLNGPWGNIASDAAQGAAARIKQLIEESQASAGTAPRTKAAQRGRG